MTGTEASSGVEGVSGVLHPQGALGRLTLERLAPDPALAALVEFYWLVRWDLRGQPPYEQKVLAHPHVHLVFEQPHPAVYGVDLGLFVRRLEGRGQVLGVKFRPGGFRPFLGGPVQELTGRVVPAVELLGPDVLETSRQILESGDPLQQKQLAEAFLLPRIPPPDPQLDEIVAMVASATEDHRLLRVEQLAERHGVSVRTLQRLFAEYVGATPKWVLRRARLHEAALRAEDSAVDWAQLADALGYADQSHLSRDFSAAVGVPPTRYARG